MLDIILQDLLELCRFFSTKREKERKTPVNIVDNYCLDRKGYPLPMFNQRATYDIGEFSKRNLRNKGSHGRLKSEIKFTS